MAKEFLRCVAEQFASVAGTDLRKYCFVFPNRRSALFFRMYLGQAIQAPVFSPTLTNVNDLFASMSGLKVADRITLLAKLYDAYREVVDPNEYFDDFVYRGEVILGDFDDIDKYLVDAAGLFGNIKDLKQIEDDYSYLSENQRAAVAMFWGNLIKPDRKNMEEQFLGMWDKLLQLYNTLREKLRAEGLAYEGMIYREVAEKIAKRDEAPEMYEECMSRFDKYDQVVFVGLNAPTNCEKKLFDALQKSGKGDFYWDYYGDAVRDEHNKSSLFMKDNVVRYKSGMALPSEADPGDERPAVEVIAVPSAVGQAKCVHSILSDVCKGMDEKQLLSTAVVLPDENLLLPVLNSIPAEIPKVNVTMGKSIFNSEAYSFICRLMDLQGRVEEKDGVMSFYYKDVFGLLSHSYLKNSADVSARLREKIRKENMIYVPFSYLQEEGELFSVLFEPVSTCDCAQEALAALMTGYLKRSIEAVAGIVGRIDKEYLLGCYKSLNLLGRLELKLSKKTYSILLRRVIAGVSIPFAGEPLAGLQVMGPLETRALDFENVIILSVNEGTFPSVNPASSLIPYNLRRGFGLPTYEYQDSISAYHFYRSICRAKKVFLLFDSRTVGQKSGEESRYVKQLEYYYKYPVVRKNVSFAMSLSDMGGEEVVAKTQNDIDKLKDLNFSASALLTYLACSKRFYYQYVLGLSEEKDLMDALDNTSFGTLYHWLMQHVYEKGRLYDKAALDDLITRMKGGKLEKMIPEAFEKSLQIRTISGKNRIAQKLLFSLVIQTLEKDKTLPEPFTLETEKLVKRPFVTASGRQVNVKGIVDRLDIMQDGSIRILDYKTGKKHFDNGEIAELFNPKKTGDNKHIFQLYFYLLLLNLDRKATAAPELCDGTTLEIYYVSEMLGGGRSSMSSEKSKYDEFCVKLSELIDEIFNLELPFKCTEISNECKYCPFISLCKK